MNAIKKVSTYQALDIYKDQAGAIAAAVLWSSGTWPTDVFRNVGGKIMRCGAYLESSDISDSWMRASFTAPGEASIESDKDGSLVIQFKNGIGTMAITPPASAMVSHPKIGMFDILHYEPTQSTGALMAASKRLGEAVIASHSTFSIEHPESSEEDSAARPRM
jgi:hypothetical protein